MWKPLALVSLLLVATAVWACGDKLVLVMSSQSSQIRPHHSASILAYPGQYASAALIRGLQSEAALRKAGYRIQVVEDSAGLDNALKAGKYDLVVTDVENANEMSRQVSLAASKPVVLPVAFKASKEQQSEAQKRYHCLLKGPGNAGNYLEAIDRAMDLKLKGNR